MDWSAVDWSAVDWSAVSGLSSAVIALVALVFSMVTFQRQQERSERELRASVKPRLWIQSQIYENNKAILLMNHGIGPAIIRTAVFNKGNKSTDSIVKLFDLGRLRWETFVGIKKGRAIPAQKEMTLVRLSLPHLMKQGFGEDQALKMLSSWQAQKSGITVRIEYEDILGNAMPPRVEKLN